MKNCSKSEYPLKNIFPPEHTQSSQSVVQNLWRPSGHLLQCHFLLLLSVCVCVCRGLACTAVNTHWSPSRDPPHACFNKGVKCRIRSGFWCAGVKCVKTELAIKAGTEISDTVIRFLEAANMIFNLQPSVGSQGRLFCLVSSLETSANIWRSWDLNLKLAKASWSYCALPSPMIWKLSRLKWYGGLIKGTDDQLMETSCLHP